MDQPRVKLDPDTRLGPVEKLREPLEDQLTSALQAAVDQVERHHADADVDEIQQELLDRTRAGLHRDVARAFEPDEEQLREVAAEIADDH